MKFESATIAGSRSTENEYSKADKTNGICAVFCVISHMKEKWNEWQSRYWKWHEENTNGAEVCPELYHTRYSIDSIRYFILLFYVYMWNYHVEDPIPNPFISYIL